MRSQRIHWTCGIGWTRRGSDMARSSISGERLCMPAMRRMKTLTLLSSTIRMSSWWEEADFLGHVILVCVRCLLPTG
jgi:hypothetical protein